jgi:predicted RNA-binding protein YlxR (DUF448 family)
LSTAKHIPQRTCVGCRTTSAKREFVRIVRTPEATVQVDATGKLSGRGAYVCASRSCWEDALKKDRLAHALRTTISPDDRAELLSYAERLEPATTAVGG